MQDAQYIGSLLVEDISPRPKGEPSIEMVISASEDGIITADACDLDASPGGEHHTLNVSLKTEGSSKPDGFPDFDIESKRQTPTGLYGQAELREEERSPPWLIVALASAFVIVVVALLWFFFLGGRDTPIFSGGLTQKNEQATPITPPLPVVEKIEPGAPPPPPPQPEPPRVVEPAPVIEAPTAPPPARPQAVPRTRPPAPVSSYKVPAVIPKEGVAYRIRWGDTLWDISEAFYRNPWLYPRIARYNNIRNPDFIVAGRTIRIPPRN
jgi:nucleoid-associated protein YgaU